MDSYISSRICWRQRDVVDRVLSRKLRAHQLENFAVSAAVPRGKTGLFWQRVFAGLANQGTQLLAVGLGAQVDPLAQRIVIGKQAITPDFRLVQRLRFQSRRRMLFNQSRSDPIEHALIQLTHQLADKLHLPALALEIGDAFGL